MWKNDNFQIWSLFLYLNFLFPLHDQPRFSKHFLFSKQGHKEHQYDPRYSNDHTMEVKSFALKFLPCAIILLVLLWQLQMEEPIRKTSLKWKKDSAQMRVIHPRTKRSLAYRLLFDVFWDPPQSSREVGRIWWHHWNCYWRLLDAKVSNLLQSLCSLAERRIHKGTRTHGEPGHLTEFLHDMSVSVYPKCLCIKNYLVENQCIWDVKGEAIALEK